MKRTLLNWKQNRDFEKLIKQYDFEDAFFYCDPPYSCGCGYAVTTTEGFAHEKLREVLGNIKGRFLLSYDDSPKIRELYKGFEMIEVERLNGINNKNGGAERKNKMFKELLIANYPIKELHENGKHTLDFNASQAQQKSRLVAHDNSQN